MEVVTFKWRSRLRPGGCLGVECGPGVGDRLHVLAVEYRSRGSDGKMERVCGWMHILLQHARKADKGYYTQRRGNVCVCVCTLGMSPEATQDWFWYQVNAKILKTYPFLFNTVAHGYQGWDCSRPDRSSPLQSPQPHWKLYKKEPTLKIKRLLLLNHLPFIYKHGLVQILTVTK